MTAPRAAGSAGHAPPEQGPAAFAADPERRRLAEARDGFEPWYRWGPYLSERQWATVREDYSRDGTAWEYFPHDHARSRAYRWGEDGLLGICDEQGLLCFAFALWNGHDPILKERLFGLTGNEGNHGEDVKECYWFLDNTPAHTYMRALYRYPQRAFPYTDLLAENARRTRDDPEYELFDTGAFAGDRFFDLTVEYAKGGPEDIFVRATVENAGPEQATLHLFPTLWFRNTWSWGYDGARPQIEVKDPGAAATTLVANHQQRGPMYLAADGQPKLLFTDNDTNTHRLWGMSNSSPFVKDGIHRAVVEGDPDAVNFRNTGTKAALHYVLDLPPGGSAVVQLRLSCDPHASPFGAADEAFEQRRREADAFYAPLAAGLTADEALVQRQAFAGLLWSKQFYYTDVDIWLRGDPTGPQPPPERLLGRNHEWRHLNNADILSMPDTWEYPWFAAWDLAFHCVPLALLDPEFAKEQLVLLLREWYMHPNGQLPAYEWAFGDVNPPVHAWAAWHVYKTERDLTGQADRAFLERVFHKLLLNFTWWVNRKDSEGNNVFAGGFLGLDNIGVFDRSKELPTGGHLEQSDGTAWMGMYCLNMLAIALELACEDPVYEDVATKFFEHFLYIAGALNNIGNAGITLWDDTDEFFYDVLHLPDGRELPLKVRSLVGLIPLLAVETIEPAMLDKLPAFKGRMDWFLENRPDLASLVSRWQEPGMGERHLLALVRGHRMKALLRRMLDPDEFLGDYGIRALSRYHLDHPYELTIDGTTHMVRYEPAESRSGLFGGNSNWRGPIWFPINHLLVEALRKFHHYYGDDFVVEHPAAAQEMNLAVIADDIAKRLASIFLRGSDGRRPVFGGNATYQEHPHWRDLIPFHEYFHGDDGAGLGASHQTGWTALVAALLRSTRSP